MWRRTVYQQLTPDYHPHKCCTERATPATFKHRSASSNQGRLSPQQPWRSPHPPISRPHPFLPTSPANNLLYTQFCAIYAVFSEFWKMSVRDNDPPPKKKICMLSFLSEGVKRNRATTANEKIFEKMIGRL